MEIRIKQDWLRTAWPQGAPVALRQVALRQESRRPGNPCQQPGKFPQFPPKIPQCESLILPNIADNCRKLLGEKKGARNHAARRSLSASIRPSAVKRIRVLRLRYLRFLLLIPRPKFVPPRRDSRPFVVRSPCRALSHPIVRGGRHDCDCRASKRKPLSLNSRPTQSNQVKPHQPGGRTSQIRCPLLNSSTLNSSTRPIKDNILLESRNRRL
jgi:hypothetical protein